MISKSKYLKYKEQVKKWGGKYVYDDMNRKNAQAIYNDAKRLKEAGYDLSKYKNAKTLDRQSDKLRDTQKREEAAKAAEEAAKQKAEYVKAVKAGTISLPKTTKVIRDADNRNVVTDYKGRTLYVGDTGGTFYSAGKGRRLATPEDNFVTMMSKSGSRTTVTLDRYKREFADSDTWKPVTTNELQAYTAEREKEYAKIKAERDAANEARREAADARVEAEKQRQKQALIDSITGVSKSTTPTVKFSNLSESQKAEIRKGDTAGITYTDTKTPSVKTATETISATVAAAPEVKIPETKVTATEIKTPTTSDPYSSFANVLTEATRTQSTFESPGEVAQVVTPKVDTTSAKIYGPTQQTTDITPKEKSKSISSKIYGTASKTVASVFSNLRDTATKPIVPVVGATSVITPDIEVTSPTVSSKIYGPVQQTASEKKSEELQSTFESPGVTAEVIDTSKTKSMDSSSYTGYVNPFEEALQQSLMPTPDTRTESEILTSKYQRQYDKDISSVGIPESINTEANLQLWTGEEEKVAAKLIATNAQNLIDKRTEQRNKIEAELVAMGSSIEDKNTELTKISDKLQLDESNIISDYGLYQKSEVDPTTGEARSVYYSRKAEKALDEYNDLLASYKVNPTEENYNKALAAQENYNKINVNLSSSMSDLVDRQQALTSEIQTTESNLEDYNLKLKEYNTLTENIQGIERAANFNLEKLGQADKLAVFSEYYDDLAKGKYATSKGEAVTDWLKGEAGQFGVGLAKLGRGITRAFGTEAIESVQEDIEKKGYLGTATDVKSGGIGGSYIKGVLSSVYKPGEYQKIAEEIAPETDLGYQLSDKKLGQKLSGVWEQTDKEAAAGLLTVGTLGVGSAIGGASAGGAATLAKGTTYAKALGGAYATVTAVPQVFKVTAKENLPEEAQEIIEKDRATFVDAMRAGYEKEAIYNQQTKGFLGNFIEEIPGVPIVTGAYDIKKRTTFKQGVRDYYVNQGYNYQDANIMAEAAWKQRNAGLAGEAVGVASANIASEIAGGKFLSNALKGTTAAEAATPTLTGLGKVGAKSAWEVGKAGTIEGVAVARSKQLGRYEKTDYGEMFGFGTAGGVTAGIIGGAIGTASAAGKTGLRRSILGSVYVTDPYEPIGDLAEKGFSKIIGKTSKVVKSAVTRKPVVTYTPTTTVGVGSQTLSAGTYETTPNYALSGTTLTSSETLTAPEVTQLSSSALIESPALTGVDTNINKISYGTSSNIAASTTIGDSTQTYKEAQETTKNKIRTIIGKSSPSTYEQTISSPTEISANIPSMISTSPSTQTVISVPPSVAPSTATSTATSPETLTNVPIQVPTEVPIEVPSYISTSTAVPVSTTPGIPYLKGGFAQDMFGFNRGVGAGGWNFENKIQDIAGQWLEKQKTTGTLSTLDVGKKVLPTFGNMNPQMPRRNVQSSATVNRMMSTGRTMPQTLPLNIKSTANKKSTTKNQKTLKDKIKTKQTTKKLKSDTKRVAGFFKR